VRIKSSIRWSFLFNQGFGFWLVFVVFLNIRRIIRKELLRINMKNCRSQLEIYIDVLNTIKEGTTKPTRIMYGINLSWKLLQGVLLSLIDQDLIEEVDQSGSRDKRTNVIYRVTAKGDGVIKYFGYAKRIVDVDGEASFNPFQITQTREI